MKRSRAASRPLDSQSPHQWGNWGRWSWNREPWVQQDSASGPREPWVQQPDEAGEPAPVGLQPSAALADQDTVEHRREEWAPVGPPKAAGPPRTAS
eukprot:8914213-Pyramimonas_sp.AAC.1